MIRRIVKMDFEKRHVEEFLKLFDQNKNKIKSQEGCYELKLLRDVREGGIIFTSSLWADEQSLDNYRKSELFKVVWSQTKQLFCNKPEAWSCWEEVV